MRQIAEEGRVSARKALVRGDPEPRSLQHAILGG